MALLSSSAYASDGGHSEGRRVDGDLETMILPGKHVVVQYRESEHRAVVRFVGTTSFSPGKWVGIELEEAIGKNNGTMLGTTYFECQEFHGAFVRLSCVLRIFCSTANAWLDVGAMHDFVHPVSVDLSRYRQQPPSTVRMIKDLYNSSADSAQQDQLASVKGRIASIEERMNSLARVESLINSVVDEFIGGTTNKLNVLETGLMAHEARFGSLESLIGENADKCAKEVEVVQQKLGDLSKRIVADAKHDQLASVEEQITSFEKFKFESPEILASVDERMQTFGESMRSRLGALEALIGENADKCARQVEVVQQKLGDLSKSVVVDAKICEPPEILASVDERMQTFGESMRSRLGALEALIDKGILGGAKRDQLEERVFSLEESIAELRDEMMRALAPQSEDDAHRILMFQEKALALDQLADKLEKYQIAHGKRDETIRTLAPQSEDDAHRMNMFQEKAFALDQIADKLEKYQIAQGKRDEMMRTLAPQSEDDTHRILMSQEKALAFGKEIAHRDQQIAMLSFTHKTEVGHLSEELKKATEEIQRKDEIILAKNKETQAPNERYGGQDIELTQELKEQHEMEVRHLKKLIAKKEDEQRSQREYTIALKKDKDRLKANYDSVADQLRQKSGFS